MASACNQGVRFLIDPVSDKATWSDPSEQGSRMGSAPVAPRHCTPPFRSRI